ncbi:MAG: glycosyltransferase 87 family protein [Amnibacterium sp.]
MSATAVRPRAPGAALRRAPGTKRWLWLGFLAALGVVAFLIRLRLLTATGGLDGTDGYDDGVYYAAADALVHGRLPYRDFLFLQPPGVVLAIAPFAWLGSLTQDPIGVTAARLAFEAVGAVNAVLVAVVGRRFGRVGGVAAGVVYAVLFPAAYTERSSLLEPLGTLGLLVAVLLLQRADRWPRAGVIVAGAAAGIAIGMKIWYVVPVAVIAAFHWRRLWRVTAGVAIGAGLVYLPFFLLGPAPMLQQVVLDQLGRPRDSATPLRRMASLVAAPQLPHLPAQLHTLLTPSRIGFALILVVAVCAIAVLTVRGARLVAALLAATVLVLVASPSWFEHYGALTAPWVALTVGIGGARLLARIRSVPIRSAVAALALGGLVLLELQTIAAAAPSQPVPVSALGSAAQAVQGCVLADDPQILAALDVLSRDLDRGCPLHPDVTGYTYDRDSMKRGGVEVARPANPRWQRDVRSYLLSGQAVIVHRAGTGLSASSRRAIDAGPVLAAQDGWVLHATRR